MPHEGDYALYPEGTQDVPARPDALRLLATREDLPHGLQAALVNDNARRCFGIANAFQPANRSAA